MRKKLFKWHSYLALIAMLPILIMSLTGSLLVFKVEIDSYLRPHQMVVNADLAQQRKSIDELMQAVVQKHPDYVLAGWELFGNKQIDVSNKLSGKHRSDTAYMIKKNTSDWYKLYINQYNAELLSEPKDMEHYITDWLLELHYAFLLHFSGTVIGAIFGLILLFLGISGIVLYRKFWRHFFTLRFAAAKRILFSDLHKLVGISSSPVLLVIAFTGVYWNVSIILHEVLEHGFEEEHPAITQPYHSADISFEQLRLKNKRLIDSFEANYLAIPNEPNMDITFFGEVDTANFLLSQYASSVTYHHKTGKVVHQSDIRETGFWRKFDDSTRKLHFGYFAGIWSKVLWCIVGLSPLLLAISGLVMYALRPKSKRKRKNA